MWRSEPRRPRRAVPEERSLDEHDGRRARAGTAPRPRLEPGRGDDLLRASRRAPAGRSTSRAIFPVSALRSPGTSATTGAPSQTRTSDLTIWPSVQPMASAAACAVGVSVANSSSRASAPVVAEEDGDALDGLGPGRHSVEPGTSRRGTRVRVVRRSPDALRGDTAPRRAIFPAQSTASTRVSASATGPGEQRPAEEEQQAARVDRMANDANGPVSTSGAPSSGRGNGVSARPSDRPAATATTAPRQERAPRRRRRATSRAPSGQSGGTTTATSAAPMSANCATTQPPPRSAHPSSTKRTSSKPIVVQVVDELGGRRRVDREHHQRLARPPSSATPPCSRC